MFKTILLAALAISACFAQTTTGAITGTITDASGAAIPNVRVTATNTATNVATNTQSNESGVYTFPCLSIGNYTVAVEAQGFKKTVLGPFALEVNQIARINPKLDVGAITE